MLVVDIAVVGLSIHPDHESTWSYKQICGQYGLTFRQDGVVNTQMIRGIEVHEVLHLQ